MAGELYYLDQRLYKRVGTIDYLTKSTENIDYLATRVLDINQSFVATVDTVIINTPGTYLIMASVETLTATVEITADTNKIPFKQFMSTIISVTGAISIKSDITTNINLIAIKI